MESFVVGALAGAAVAAFLLTRMAGWSLAPCATDPSGGVPAEDPSAALRVLRRRVGFCPRSRRSHRRKVSWPISMPSNRKPRAKDSTDSPVWRSRSNSSRCGSNCAVAGLRGCRAWATAWTSVVGRGGVSGEWMGSDMVVNGSPYAWWLGGARGAPRAPSKRPRLDVGVLPSAFYLFLFGAPGCSSRSCPGWVAGGKFGFLSVSEWRRCGACGESSDLESRGSCFSAEVGGAGGSSRAQSSAVGGGGC